MKYCSEEWFEEHKKLLGEAFSKPSALTTELVEVHNNCEGEKTVWVYYRVEKGLVADIRRGEGEDTVPKAMFRCFGEYDTYARIVSGELDPTKGIMTKKIKLQGNIMKAKDMLDVYAKVTEAKRVPGLEL